jgi:arylsulfatase A-like enzyme
MSIGSARVWISMAALVAAVFVVPEAVTALAPPPPNIVVILADDMRFDQMDDMPTVMRELVGKGRSFERGFIVDPVCCPSRTSFLRGQYAHTTSVFDIGGPWGGRNQLMTARAETEMLNTWLDPTHFTALVGKYLNGYTSVPLPGPAGSWDFGRVLHKPGYPAGGWTYTDGMRRRTGQEYSTEFLNRSAVDAIEASGEEPVFLWYAPYAPHNPMIPRSMHANETEQCGDVDYRESPSFDEARTDTAVVDGLSGMKDKARWQKNRKPFASEKALSEGRTKPMNGCRALLSVDDGVAAILAALERKDPGLDHTVVVFTSDQGVQYGEHGWLPKRIAFEGTIQVPYVMRADGLLAEQPTVDAINLVLNIDLAPTLLELAGASGSPGCPTEDPYRARCLERGGGFDGTSFTTLLGPSVEPVPGFADRVFLIEMFAEGTFPEYCAVRSADAKLIRYDRDSGPDFEGYDLTGAYGRADPFELHSVVSSNAKGVVTFRAGGRDLYEDLYPSLRSLCDPLPPGYPAFP